MREAKGRKINDLVFGDFIWDTFWEGKVEVPGFGEMPVNVETDVEMYAVATPRATRTARP